MAFRFCDSFDHYATADITNKWNTSSATGIVGSGRNGNCLQLDYNQIISKTLDAQATWIVGIAFKTTSLASENLILSLRDAGTNQCSVRVNTDGTLSVLRGSTVLATSILAISINTWYYIEFKVTIADAGTYQVRVNGVDWIASGSGDTQATANASANQIALYQAGSYSSYFDDLYVCDGTGASNNNFLGDVRVDALLPSGAGTTTAWTPSTGANYTCVDEAAPNDTDYVESATANQVDTYAMGNLPYAAGSVFAVQVVDMARKTDAGARSIQTAVRSGASDYYGSTVSLGDTYVAVMKQYDTDPADSAAWTVTKVNALEAGIKLIA